MVVWFATSVSVRACLTRTLGSDHSRRNERNLAVNKLYGVWSEMSKANVITPERAVMMQRLQTIGDELRLVVYCRIYA